MADALSHDGVSDSLREKQLACQRFLIGLPSLFLKIGCPQIDHCGGFEATGKTPFWGLDVLAKVPPMSDHGLQCRFRTVVQTEDEGST
jgi:hypothetical protein